MEERGKSYLGLGSSTESSSPNLSFTLGPDRVILHCYNLNPLDWVFPPSGGKLGALGLLLHTICKKGTRGTG